MSLQQCISIITLLRVQSSFDDFSNLLLFNVLASGLREFTVTNLNDTLADNNCIGCRRFLTIIVSVRLQQAMTVL